MKIIHIAVTFARSGTELIILNLAARSLLNGDKVGIIMPGGNESLNYWAEEARSLGIKVHGVGPLHNSDPKRNRFQNLIDIYKILKIEKPDIVHFHYPWATVGYETILAAAMAGVPLRIRTEQNPLLSVLSRKEFLLMSILDKLVHSFHFVSTGNYLSHIRAGRRIKSKSSVIPNGVDPKSIRSTTTAQSKKIIRDTLNIPSHKVVAMMLANLNLRKGTLDFIEAAAIASKLDLNLDFALIGDGPLLGEAKNLAEVRGIAERVHFMGRRHDARDLLCCFDIYVQPSHYEGMSLAMLEALAAGLPMVTTRVDGVSDVFPNEEGAIFVDISDIQGLAAGMAQLSQNADLRNRLSGYSKSRVDSSFTIDSIFECYQKVYLRKC